MRNIFVSHAQETSIAEALSLVTNAWHRRCLFRGYLAKTAYEKALLAGYPRFEALLGYVGLKVSCWLGCISTTICYRLYRRLKFELKCSEASVISHMNWYFHLGMMCRIVQFHRSQNALPYSTMLHSEHKRAQFCSEWNVVVNEAGAFCDLWIWPIVANDTRMSRK